MLSSNNTVSLYVCQCCFAAISAHKLFVDIGFGNDNHHTVYWYMLLYNV